MLRNKILFAVFAMSNVISHVFASDIVPDEVIKTLDASIKHLENAAKSHQTLNPDELDQAFKTQADRRELEEKLGRPLSPQEQYLCNKYLYQNGENYISAAAKAGFIREDESGQKFVLSPDKVIGGLIRNNEAANELLSEKDEEIKEHKNAATIVFATGLSVGVVSTLSLQKIGWPIVKKMANQSSTLALSILSLNEGRTVFEITNNALGSLKGSSTTPLEQITLATTINSIGQSLHYHKASRHILMLRPQDIATSEQRHKIMLNHPEISSLNPGEENSIKLYKTSARDIGLIFARVLGTAAIEITPLFQSLPSAAQQASLKMGETPILSSANIVHVFKEVGKESLDTYISTKLSSNTTNKLFTPEQMAKIISSHMNDELYYNRFVGFISGLQNSLDSSPILSDKLGSIVRKIADKMPKTKAFQSALTLYDDSPIERKRHLTNSLLKQIIRIAAGGNGYCETQLQENIRLYAIRLLNSDAQLYARPFNRKDLALIPARTLGNNILNSFPIPKEDCAFKIKDRVIISQNMLLRATKETCKDTLNASVNTLLSSNTTDKGVDVKKVAHLFALNVAREVGYSALCQKMHDVGTSSQTLAFLTELFPKDANPQNAIQESVRTATLWTMNGCGNLLKWCGNNICNLDKIAHFIVFFP